MSNIQVNNKESISVNITQSGYNKTTVVKQPTKTVGVTGLKGGGDKNYIHSQSVPSDTWTVSHNLGKKPAVMVVDSADEVVYGNITYNDINNVTITFNGAFSGKAYFN